MITVEQVFASAGSWQQAAGERIDPVPITRALVDRPCGRVASAAGADWALRLCHFPGNQHLPLWVALPFVRIPTEHPDALALRLRQQWTSAPSFSAHPGKRDDSLPKAYAHE